MRIIAVSSGLELLTNFVCLVLGCPSIIIVSIIVYLVSRGQVSIIKKWSYMMLIEAYFLHSS
jgi:hypothetical protein